MDNFVHTDIICFSHLRWYFVYQRPQHILSRFAKHQRVFFFEEPVIGSEEFLEIKKADGDLFIVTPNLQEGDEEATLAGQRRMLDKLMSLMDIRKYISWYYSPLALRYSDHLQPSITVYDCMDELSAFRFAPKELKQMETLLYSKSDIVFTGGMCLYEARQHLHDNIHCFPSSIDQEHFEKARMPVIDPADQAGIPHPRIGFYGVIDERFNTTLLQKLADQQKQWHFVILGPMAKIDPKSLPTGDNIHFLGPKSYEELPLYLAGWDVAMMPFALNESTRYISPTKTPEYLAGGKQVVSTSIKDVVRPYGDKKLVYIADTVNEFSAAINEALENKDNKEWLKEVDSFLSGNSWDLTVGNMRNLIFKAWEDKKRIPGIKQQQAYV